MSERRDAASLFAHTLKSPLASLRTASELLWKHIQSQLTEKDRQLLDAIVRNSKTLELRVNRILEYSNPHGQAEEHFLLSVSRENLETIHSLLAERPQALAEVTGEASEIPIIAIDEIVRSNEPKNNSLPEKVIVHADPEIADLIPKFLENRKKDILAIHEALDQNDFGRIRVIGHSMKGAGGGYGFSDVTAIGKVLEEGAKEGNREMILKGVADLALYLERVEVIYD